MELDTLIDNLVKLKVPSDIFPAVGDYHAKNAITFFGEDFCRNLYFNDYKEFKNRFRFIAKTTGLAIVYGANWKIFLDVVPNCTESEARKLYNNFFLRLPKFAQYDKCLLDSALKNGFIKTILGRVIYIDGLNSDNWRLRSKAQREVKNYPIQGSGAEIIKYILSDLFHFVQDNNLSRWVGNIHKRRYYNRIILVNDSEDLDSLGNDLDSLRDGNCKVLVVRDSKPVKEFDRNVCLTMDLVIKYNMLIYL